MMGQLGSGVTLHGHHVTFLQQNIKTVRPIAVGEFKSYWFCQLTMKKH